MNELRTKKRRRPRTSKKHSPTSPHAIVVEQRRAEALQYRLQGWLYAQIAEAISVSEGRAWQLVDEDGRYADLCDELGISSQTLYRHVSPTGELRADGKKLLTRS